VLEIGCDIVPVHQVAWRHRWRLNQRFLNYTCAALIYGDAMTNDPDIAGLLEKVKAKQISLDTALDQFP
jgi:hypothetical protein